MADALAGLAARVNELEGMVAELTGKRPEGAEVSAAAAHAAAATPPGG